MTTDLLNEQSTEIATCYSGLLQNDVETLKSIKNDINIIRGQATYALGKKLMQAQEIYNNRGGKGGGFVLWLKEEYDASERDAYDAIGYAKNCDEYGLQNSANHFMKSVSVFLGQKSTPKKVFEQAIEKAESGEKVTIKDVKEWKAKALEFQNAKNDLEKKASEQASLLKEKESLLNEKDAQIIALQNVETQVIEIEKPLSEYSEHRNIQNELKVAQEKLDNLTKQKNELEKKIETITANVPNEIDKGLKNKLKEYQNEINEATLTFDAIQKRCDYLRTERDALEKQIDANNWHLALADRFEKDMKSIIADLEYHASEHDFADNEIVIAKWENALRVIDRVKKGIRFMLDNAHNAETHNENVVSVIESDTNTVEMFENETPFIAEDKSINPDDKVKIQWLTTYQGDIENQVKTGDKSKISREIAICLFNIAQDIEFPRATGFQILSNGYCEIINSGNSDKQNEFDAQLKIMGTDLLGNDLFSEYLGKYFAG